MNKLSKFQQRLLDKPALKLSVTIYNAQAPTQLYHFNDGQQPDQLNTVRATSPLHALSKIRDRYVRNFRKLQFRLARRQQTPAWHPTTDFTSHRYRIQLHARLKAESSPLKAIQDLQQRYQHLHGHHLPPELILPDTPIDESLIEWDDPEDFDIQDGQ